jgi:hypothetical protein
MQFTDIFVVAFVLFSMLERTFAAFGAVAVLIWLLM